MITDKELEIVKGAVLHALGRIHADANVAYRMGHFTESYERLCAAGAVLLALPVAQVKERFDPCDDEADLDIRRIDVRNQMEEMQGDLDGQLMGGIDSRSRMLMECVNRLRRLLDMPEIEAVGSEWREVQS